MSASFCGLASMCRISYQVRGTTRRSMAIVSSFFFLSYTFAARISAFGMNSLY